MSDIKTKMQGVEANISPQDIKDFVKDTGNIYESLVVISKRASQLSVELKKELNDKLNEFAITSDTIEEITENKEQIEISKFYERLPNPAKIATLEFLNGELHYDLKDKYKQKDDA